MVMDEIRGAFSKVVSTPMNSTTGASSLLLTIITVCVCVSRHNCQAMQSSEEAAGTSLHISTQSPSPSPSSSPSPSPSSPSQFPSRPSPSPSSPSPLVIGDAYSHHVLAAIPTCITIIGEGITMVFLPMILLMKTISFFRRRRIRKCSRMAIHGTITIPVAITITTLL